MKMNTLVLLAICVACACAAPNPAPQGAAPEANRGDWAAIYEFEVSHSIIKNIKTLPLTEKLLSNICRALADAPASLFKRAPLLQSKRHISPSYDVEIDAGNMRNLLDVGKRSAPMAADYGNQFQMYNRLIDAGKKKRSSMISPSYQFEDALGLSDALERAGRR
ncbi:Protein CBR-NLP-11 [Caenorhabditis briggsae]|uniref:Protein CBR-NLP-11 n=1 Tax=Caenorhabditis briggsae TaxID=6238 RepID=A8WP17_CAEBR|nr:Protein CBR-NLP-11 [Caenorhabditis briggsae]CAP22223.2 Protein CBR-NLP-11 [Caenorhabditis briggsae]